MAGRIFRCPCIIHMWSWMGRMRSAKWSTESYMPNKLKLGEPHPQNCLYNCKKLVLQNQTPVMKVHPLTTKFLLYLMQKASNMSYRCTRMICVGIGYMMRTWNSWMGRETFADSFAKCFLNVFPYDQLIEFSISTTSTGTQEKVTK